MANRCFARHLANRARHLVIPVVPLGHGARDHLRQGAGSQTFQVHGAGQNCGAWELIEMPRLGRHECRQGSDDDE